ncbi:hypothetical protein [Streptomyces radicis]|uniref:Uncharacterized protein n=1 Tax=Streptomyces radicis TaxID=1750517 RepID=A0A3A9WFZ3_9ACTN|nr:hypothetical protein [Streptomyces radicis]RKN08344.1 hypothetical protein D7319_15505 [Streptomyces radicis]RKN21620.1 hypothetical protein D7318_16960 [Streptomyces radicis]
MPTLPPPLRLRFLTLAALTAALVALAAGPAHADTNDNIADPPLACGGGPLSLDTGRVCHAEQHIEQDITKADATTTDLVGFLDVVFPLDVTPLS